MSELNINHCVLSNKAEAPSFSFFFFLFLLMINCQVLLLLVKYRSHTLEV